MEYLNLILYLYRMNIYLFDFDNTIVKLPYQETIEYLDQKESLDPKLNFKLVDRTRQDYLKVLDYDPDGLFLILSNRVVDVGDSLNKLLKHLGFIFDGYFLVDGADRNKGSRVKKIIEKITQKLN